MELTPGIYRHYKGQEYEVIGVARHEETHEALVVYRALYDSPDFGKNALWVRSLSVFTEEVLVDGVRIPRFAFLRNV